MAGRATWVAVALLVALMAVVRPVNCKRMPLVVRAEGFEDRITSGGRWFVQFHDPNCGMCKIMTPRFRKVAKHFIRTDDIFFAKFNCVAEYNEDFCAVHSIREKPTYVLFDEYRTTGHRYLPPSQPSDGEMRRWLQSALNTDNATQSFPPELMVDLDMRARWKFADLRDEGGIEVLTPQQVAMEREREEHEARFGVSTFADAPPADAATADGAGAAASMEVDSNGNVGAASA